MTKQKIFLGVDPGRSKTGLGLVQADGTLIKYAVVLMPNFKEEVKVFVEEWEVDTIVVGNGTTSQQMQETLRELFPVPLVIVEEGHSTEEARGLYWQLYPPKGLKRLIPLGLQVPPINLDGLAAVILVRRYLQQQRN